MPLKDKMAIITGAGRGIGRAIALDFAASGAKVALVARTEEEINRVADEIAALSGVAAALPCDVADESQVNAMVAEALGRLGPVDILVNNAGVMILNSIAETTVEEWDTVMNTNLRGAFLCSKAVLPSMMQRRTGRIVNISSMCGRRGYPAQGAYSASKHGLYGLSKVLAIEGQGYGIRVNVISPGGAHTELSRELLATRSPAEVAEWMTPEEVAAAVHYIVTQDGPAHTDELVLRRFASEPWR